MRPKNYHPYIVNSPSRRRGQALLLAVLVMVFVVLLGTTFLAIVSSNMSQTARTSSKDQARQAAQAGIDFVDEELTGSDEGLDWRPATPGIAGGAYNFYWTAFDRAQGWDQQFYTLQSGSATQASFVKYPNPLAFSPAGNGSNFMIRVSQVQDSDPDNALNTKTGDIRIESIGIANDDPAAFYKTVAYKQGPASNPLTAAMRSVTNWDFGNSTVPQGYMSVTGPTVPLPTLTLSNTKGYFDNADCPFYVTLTSLTGANTVLGAIVTNVNYTNPNAPVLTLDTSKGTPTVTLSGPTGTIFVQKAAGLGAPAAVQFDNATNTPVDYRISGINNFAGTGVNTPGSVWVNGGLVWFGNSNANNLVAPSAASASQPASYIKVSGLFASDIFAPTTVQATGTNIGTATALPTNSLDTSYSTNAVVTNGLLDDGLNRLAGASSTSRQVQDFTPPDITSGGDGFGRYRELTRYSSSAVPTTGVPYYSGATNISSAYGYGAGIYINNAQDVEKKGTAVMTQTDLQNLWYTLGTAATTSFERSALPADPTVTSNSLEEQHMRGWVSPDQFLPRGAEVIINSNNTITVNLDPMEDNSTTYPSANLASSTPTPDPAKGWRDVSGNLMGDGPSGTNTGGVYSQTFNWPANGTLFAEGNIRIRGTDATAPSSLTVVSMNNIYIEGSLSAGAKKVLLLAKRNVIVNPTQVLEDVQSVTRLSGPAAVGGTSVSVYDASNFRAGEYIQISGDANVYGIQSITGNTITLGSALATAQLANAVVTAAFDPRTDAGSYATDNNKPYSTAIRLSQPSNIIQRRVQWPNTTTDIRLAFRHSAEYRKALEVGIRHPITPPNAPDIVTASLTNKIKLGATSPQDIIQAADKALTVTYTQNPAGTPDPGTDTFLTPAPTNQATAAGPTSNLSALVTQMTSKYPDSQWSYDPTTTVVDPNYATATTQPPFYFLASAGSRYPFSYTPQPTTATPSAYPPVSEPSEPVFPAPTAGTINLPMATSVRLLMNNAQTPLSLFPGLDIVNQFGFSPIFIDSNPQNEAEDVLTTDQYFYQPHLPVTPPYPGADPANPGYFPGVPDITGAYTSTYQGQDQYDKDSQYTLDSRTLEQAPVAGDNEIALQLNNATVNGADTVQSYFTYKTSSTDNTHFPMPFYRLSNLKLQNEGFDGGTPPNLNQVNPGAALDINAYVYAQEGGWYVISGPTFDATVKNGQDLNRDGVISQGESAAAYQYHRYNYQIVFTGAIMENQTALVNSGSFTGAVGDWMDKWATVKLAAANFTGGSVVPNASLTYDSANPGTSNFADIVYYYDPAAAQGTITMGPGFHAPVAPGLIYQG